MLGIANAQVCSTRALYPQDRPRAQASWGRAPHNPDVKLHYLHRPPAEPAGTAAPLLVLLHGVGSNEEDLYQLADQFDPRFFVASLRAPYSIGPGAHAWFSVQFGPDGPMHDPVLAEDSRQALIENLPRLAADHGLDPARIYLCGFSQGAIMGTYLMLTEPGMVAGLAAMSGRVLPEAIEKRAPDSELAGRPVLWVHGTQDQVLPIRFGRAAQDSLSRLPLDFEYAEFDMPHTVTQASLGRVSGWLSRRLDR